MKYLLFGFLILGIFNSNARAQLGVEVGGSYNIQSGYFKAPCRCTMANGNGIGFFGGVPINLVSLAGFSIGIEPAYEVQKFTSQEVFPDSLTPVANGDQEEVTMPYISISPYVRYTFPLGLFLEVAPGLKYLLTPSFQHLGAEDPGISPTASISVNAQRYDGRVAVGYTLGMGSLSISPMISAAFPFTSVSELEASGWHVTTIYGSVIVGL